MTLRRELAFATDQALILAADLAAQDEAATEPGAEASHSNQQLIDAAEAHLRSCVVKAEGGRNWPYFTTQANELRVYGMGIALYFDFTLSMTRLFWLCALLMLPVIGLSWAGNGLATESPNDPGFFAASSFGNLVNAQGKIQLGCFNWDAADAAFFLGLLDAICTALLFISALWFRFVNIGDALSAEQLTVVTPDAFTIFVDYLPRRLEGDKHKEYDQLLREHFELMLQAAVTPANAFAGLRVVSAECPPPEEPPQRSCCSRFCSVFFEPPFDIAGRRRGVISSVDTEDRNVCTVEWPPAAGSQKDRREEIFYDWQQGAGLQDSALLNRIEAACIPLPAQGEKGCQVYDVALVRDFGGYLAGMKSLVEAEEKKHEENQKKSDGDESAPPPSAEGGEGAAGHPQNEFAAASNKGRVQNLDFNDHDVLGAFVTFTHANVKEFIEQEYRFSRIWPLGRFLQGQGLLFQGCGIRVQKAPEPSEILWTNVDCPTLKRRVKTLIVTLSFIVLLSLIICALAWAQQVRENASVDLGSSCQTGSNVTTGANSTLSVTCQCELVGLSDVLQNRPSGIRDTCDSWLRKQLESQGITAGVTVGTIIINVVAAVLINFLADYMQPVFISSRFSSALVMTFGLKTVTLGIVVFLINLDSQISLFGLNGLFGLVGAGNYADMSKRWHLVVGPEITTLFAGSLCNPLFGLALVVKFWLVKWWFQKKTEKWKDMKALFTPPQFPLHIQHADQLSAMFAAAIFSSALPFLYVLVGVRLFVMYWTDKYVFLRGCSKPLRYSQQMVETCCSWLQTAAFLHAICAILVYGNTELLPESSVGLNLNDVPPEARGWVRLWRAGSVPNTLVLLCILGWWALELLKWMLGKENFEALETAITSWMPRFCSGQLRKNRRVSVFEEPFTGRPMRQMINNKINYSYHLWDAEDFEFMHPRVERSGEHIGTCRMEGKRFKMVRRQELLENQITKTEDEIMHEGPAVPADAEIVETAEQDQSQLEHDGTAQNVDHVLLEDEQTPDSKAPKKVKAKKKVKRSTRVAAVDLVDETEAENAPLALA
eukprot:TRINITY_DN28339_c0_g1_i1.p1 TRINITY_DN28339_c0_g1~~TRINITY_DN28339_c0_g1_i1.p1  ORF type:complete len:1153 (-),score=221.99 TRINITY_DN28339_c0_g1_i1:37-3198(-)